MQPTVDFHDVEGIQVGPVMFFEQTDGHPAFWTRRITLRGNGVPYSFSLFSHTSKGLLLPGETGVQAEAVCAVDQDLPF